MTNAPLPAASSTTEATRMSGGQSPSALMAATTDSAWGPALIMGG